VSWARCHENPETCIFRVNVCNCNGLAALETFPIHIHPLSDTSVGRTEQDSSLMGHNCRASRHNLIVAATPLPNKFCKNKTYAEERPIFFRPFRRKSASIALIGPWVENIQSCDELLFGLIPIYTHIVVEGGREANFQSQILRLESMIRDLCTYNLNRTPSSRDPYSTVSLG